MQIEDNHKHSEFIKDCHNQQGITTYEALVAVSIFSLVSAVFYQTLAISTFTLDSFVDSNAAKMGLLEDASTLNRLLDQRAIVFSDGDPSDRGFILERDALLILHDRYKSDTKISREERNFICVRFVQGATMLKIMEVKNETSEDVKDLCSENEIYSVDISMKLIYQSYNDNNKYALKDYEIRSVNSITLMFTSNSGNIFNVIRLYV